MKYPLSINWVVAIDHQKRQLRSKVLPVTMEAQLGQYAQFGFPSSFLGKLLGLSLGQILHLASAPGLEVGFRGKRYKFGQLEVDGTCQLCKGW